MKTTHIDEQALRGAKEACGVSTDAETATLGVEGLIRHEAHQTLRLLRGSEASATAIPRRRAQEELLSDQTTSEQVS